MGPFLAGGPSPSSEALVFVPCKENPGVHVHPLPKGYDGSCSPTFQHTDGRLHISPTPCSPPIQLFSLYYYSYCLFFLVFILGVCVCFKNTLHTPTHTCIYTYIFIYIIKTCVCIHTHTYMYMFVCTCFYYIYVYIYVCAYIYTYTQTHLCIYTYNKNIIINTFLAASCLS